MISENHFDRGPTMGGFGSGSKWGKDCTDDMRQIDIRQLARHGYLRVGMAYGWRWKRRGEVVASINVTVDIDRVWFTYRQRERGGEWQDMRYPVRVERTACHLGGLRIWWQCPAANCGRRVAVLYGGGVFACRHCYRLAYRSQRETDSDRATRRVDVLRNRLGWEPGALNGNGQKPKGMHWRTFERLEAQHNALVTQSLAGVMAKFGCTRDHL